MLKLVIASRQLNIYSSTSIKDMIMPHFFIDPTVDNDGVINDVK
jgi:hypothetical protein